MFNCPFLGLGICLCKWDIWDIQLCIVTSNCALCLPNSSAASVIFRLSLIILFLIVLYFAIFSRSNSVTELSELFIKLAKHSVHRKTLTLIAQLVQAEALQYQRSHLVQIFCKLASFLRIQFSLPLYNI